MARVITACSVGNVLEWYDFFLFGTAAALLFGPLFFGGHGSLATTMASLATYAVGFAARPIGAAIFGHYGDRIGRKAMLLTTMVMMGLSSSLIGVLPTYGQVGYWAPVLLVVLRIFQGIAVGGEWGGSVILITENAKPRQRGFFSSFTQTGVVGGFLLSAGLFDVLQAHTGNQFLHWGWRIPFLFSAVLMIAGLIVRLKIAETTEFNDIQTSGEVHRYPVLQVARAEWRTVLQAMGANMAQSGGAYILLVFSLTYGVHIGLPASVMLRAVIAGSVVEAFTIVGFGALSDRIGRRPVFLLGAIGLIVWAAPFFMLVDTRNTALIWLAAIVALGICHSAMIGTQPAYFSELFPGNVRYSGVSIAREVSGIFAGGFGPLLATAMLAWTGQYWPIALLLAVFGLMTAVAIFLAPETLNPAGHAGNDDSKLLHAAGSRQTTGRGNMTAEA